MNTKRTIRKILFISLWLTIGTGMLMLLIAAIGKQRKDTCKDYTIIIKGSKGEELFLDKSDVIKLMKAATKGNIKGQSKKAFNLLQIEDLLEGSVWVKEARLYFDNHEVLHVTVTERTPVARLFTTGGRSFYIDESGQAMQLSDKVSARLPVFTGFPDKKKMGKSDSVLLQDIITTATYIDKDPFWSSQVAQLDISACGPACWEFEMIPLIGNHVVKLGDGKNMGEKFNRLFTFYKEVLSKSGFDKYKTIDVRYAGQVVAGRSTNPKVDAAELRRSVDKLLQQIKEAEAASEQAANSASIDPNPTSQNGNAKPTLNFDNNQGDEGDAAESVQPKPVQPKPRAVMPKRNT